MMKSLPSVSSLRALCSATAVSLLLSVAAYAEPQIILEENFTDSTLPGWDAKWGTAETWTEALADGSMGLFIKTDHAMWASAIHSLPADKIAGKLVIVEAMVKADDVRVGQAPWNCAKLMLSWLSPEGRRWAKGDGTDIQGTTQWSLRSYAAQMPADLESANLRIGFEDASGQVAYSNLRVYIDPYIRTVEQFKKHSAQVAKDRLAQMIQDHPPRLVATPGGAYEIYCDDVRIPRPAWTPAMREALLAVPVSAGAEGESLAAALSRDFAGYAAELTGGMDALSGEAADDRAVEIAGLRNRAASLADDAAPGAQVDLSLAGEPVEVNKLIFGNNINWGEFDMVTDHETGEMDSEFMETLRPMNVTFMRYPGGCNADVFDWREAIGPISERPEQTYYNRSYTAPVIYGVDEFLRMCEREGMTPIITTAFLYDTPENVIADIQEKGQRKKEWIPGYLMSAEDRIQLAADWVEYCNGSVDTPMGKLRAENGHPEPYNVIYWEVGNETWGADPVGSCDPEVYGEAFPLYVEAMKARDPNILIGFNGHVLADWMNKGLAAGGEAADFVQIHTYIGGGAPELAPSQGWFEGLMKNADVTGRLVDAASEQIETQVGWELPLIISEYGMGARGGKNVMSSMGTAVMVAGMVREFLNDPNVLGANRWCLYENYYFTPMCGPSRGKKRPSRVRPDYGVYVAFAEALGDSRYPVAGETDELKAVVFERSDSYGLVLINRGAEDFVSVMPELPGLKKGEGGYVLQSTAHALTGTENDIELARVFEGTFSFKPGEPLPVPANSVLGLVLPKDSSVAE
ncbi:MAG: hypothetical protein Q7Q73_04565 [Verrucomicrobiota bacterium JB024]|nr:hypothetical protein [Verrucomicrobiota bacterium JB024]